MARLKDLAAKTSDLFMMDPAKITVKKDWNFRVKNAEYYALLEELIASVIENGVLAPLTVNLEMGSAVTLEDGHRRHEAVMMARSRGHNIELVPCIPGARYANDADRVLSQVTRNDGVSPTPIELAHIFRRALAYGSSIADIAKKTGRSPSSVSQILEINQLAEPVKAMVADGSVSATLALAVTRSEGEAAATVLAEAHTQAKAEQVAKGNSDKPARVTAKTIGKTPEKLLAEAQKSFDLLPDEQIKTFMLWLRQTGRV